MKTHYTTIMTITTMLRCTALLSIIAFLVSGPVIAAKKSDPPQTTTDGLNLVTHTKSRTVYMADGARLDQYTKVAILDAYVAFAKNWERDYNRDALDLGRRVNDHDMERIKKRMAAEFKAVFTKTMVDTNHEVVDHTGSEVLVLRPAIINLVVTAPDLQTASRSRTFTADPGQMTLYLELYDSVTSTIIARSVDAEDAGHAGGTFQISSSVSNKVAADRVLKSWAKELAGHLGEVTTAGTADSNSDSSTDNE